MPAKFPKFEINRKTGCWIWLLCKNKTGYGELSIRKNGKKKIYRAARYFYEKYRDKIPKRLVIDHLCRNVICVNPEHLEVVTQATNIRRGIHTKLDKKKIRRIKDLYKKNKGQDLIAKQFDVHQCTISRIINGKRWIAK